MAELLAELSFRRPLSALAFFPSNPGSSGALLVLDPRTNAHRSTRKHFRISTGQRFSVELPGSRDFLALRDRARPSAQIPLKVSNVGKQRASSSIWWMETLFF